MKTFEGFIIDHWIPERNQTVGLTMIHCKKCGTNAPRETKYMAEECTEITCPTCGHNAKAVIVVSKSSEVNEP